jgi:hypothetical protein
MVVVLPPSSWMRTCKRGQWKRFGKEHGPHAPGCLSCTGAIAVLLKRAKYHNQPVNSSAGSESVEKYAVRTFNALSIVRVRAHGEGDPVVHHDRLQLLARRRSIQTVAIAKGVWKHCSMGHCITRSGKNECYTIRCCSRWRTSQRRFFQRIVV